MTSHHKWTFKKGTPRCHGERMDRLVYEAFGGQPRASMIEVGHLRCRSFKCRICERPLSPGVVKLVRFEGQDGSCISIVAFCQDHGEGWDATLRLK